MQIYQATVEQFKALWNNSNTKTYQYFLKGIKHHIIEFWTVEIDQKLIAELYIFWDSIDKDEANGIDRAYLCAFRVKKDFQGQGIGSQLMQRVLSRIKEKGYKEVTIGIDNSEYGKLKRLYDKYGFTDLLKTTHIDYHYLDEQGKPMTYDEAFQIYINRLDKKKNISRRSS